MKSIASRFGAALGIATLIEAFCAIILFLGFFVWDGLSRLAEVSHFPSIHLLPTWDHTHFGGSPYQWMLAVILLQFVIWFVVVLMSLFIYRCWVQHRRESDETI